MPISLRKAQGGSGVPIGGVTILGVGAPLPIAEFDGMEFLRSGYLIQGEAASYPDAFEAFGVPCRAWVRSAQTFGDSSSYIARAIKKDGLYVGVGRSGHASLWSTGIIYTSTNGVDWTSRYRGPGSGESADYFLTCIAHGAGLFVALGANGYLVTSPDGITWTNRTAISGASTMRSVTFANGMFLALDSNGRIYKSTTGSSGWTLLSTNSALRNITGIDAVFYAVGTNGYLASSVDGVTWTERATGTTGELSSVYQFNGLFIAAGTGASVSADGINWSKCEIGISVAALAYVAGWYVAAHPSGVSASRDGMRWVPFSNTSGMSVISDMITTADSFVLLGTNKSAATGGLICQVTQGAGVLTIGMATAFSQGEATQYMRIK